MGKFDSPSIQPQKKPALVQFGHNFWNKMTGKYERPKAVVERAPTKKREEIKKQSSKERKNILSPQSINTYRAGERLSPRETAQKVQSIFGNVESVKIPRSNGAVEVANRRSNGLFYFAGKNTPCYLDKNEVMTKNNTISAMPKRIEGIQNNVGKHIKKSIETLPQYHQGSLENRISRGIQYSKDPISDKPVYSPVAQKLGDYVARIAPPRTGTNSCGAAVGEILNNFGYADLLPQSGRDGKKWDDFLDVLVTKGYFRKVPCSNPASARPGGILVYNGGSDVGGSSTNKKFGHVEIKASDGQYVSYVKANLPGGSARHSANKGFCGNVYYPVSVPV